MNPGGAQDSSRVFIIGSNSSSDSMEWHVLDALTHLGYPVKLFDCRQQRSVGWPSPMASAIAKASSLLLREPERRIERRLLREVREFGPTVILVILGSQLSPKTVHLLRAASKVPIVCWCQDHMATLGRQYLLGAGYDIVFVKDRYMQDLFTRMVRSTTFRYLPEACNPRVHKPVVLDSAEQATYGCDVMLAGSLYYYRQEILLQLRRFNLKIWGEAPDWIIHKLQPSHMGRGVYGDAKARAAAGARIAINTLHYSEVNSLNCRAFEMAGCGAFQLISAVPVLQEHFQLDAEICAFHTAEELVEKVEHYLKHPEITRQIGARSRLRAHRDHTYEARLLHILAVTLGNDVTEAPSRELSSPPASPARRKLSAGA